jgi:hypothetical protein
MVLKAAKERPALSASSKTPAMGLKAPAVTTGAGGSILPRHRLQTRVVAPAFRNRAVIRATDGVTKASGAAAAMTLRYAVGMKVRGKTDQMTVEAEDALIAALRVKAAHPEAAITYVRKQNVRGDRRHPHSSQIDDNPA